MSAKVYRFSVVLFMPGVQAAMPAANNVKQSMRINLYFI